MQSLTEKAKQYVLAITFNSEPRQVNQRQQVSCIHNKLGYITACAN